MGFWDLKPLSGSGTLTDSLISVVDDARQLYSDFGVRNYRVFLVWVGWTASERAYGLPVVREGMSPEEAVEAVAAIDLDPDTIGVGEPTLLCEVELLPTPDVGSLGGIQKSQDAVGLTERGSVTVTQVSARYSEDYLMGLVSPFRDEKFPDSLRPGVDFFWEIREDRSSSFVAPGYAGAPDQLPGSALTPVRRRFHVAATPDRDSSTFQWVVQLRRADGERGRDGSLEEVG